jgi:uncharacterized protein YggT (Ycf19 family)
MDFAEAFWRHWYFHLPNYLLALVGYTLLGRFVLGWFVPAGWHNPIWRAFVTLTRPAIALVRPITPFFVHAALLPVVAVFWVFAARLALWVGLAASGLAPAATGGTP